MAPGPSLGRVVGLDFTRTRALILGKEKDPEREWLQALA